MEIEQCSTKSLPDQGRKKIFQVFNENEYTKYPNQWDTMKAVLRGKLIERSAYIKKMEKSYTSDLTAHLKTQEKKSRLTREE